MTNTNIFATGSKWIFGRGFQTVVESSGWLGWEKGSENFIISSCQDYSTCQHECNLVNRILFSSKSNSAMHWINTDPETVSRDSSVQLYMKQHFPAFQIVISGVPNDGFLLNDLKTLFSLSRVLLYICSVILGLLDSSFPNYMGSQYYFPENFRWNGKFYEVRFFFWFLSPSHF